MIFGSNFQQNLYTKVRWIEKVKKEKDTVALGGRKN